MKRIGIKLNQTLWNKNNIQVMEEGIKKRAHTDVVFKEILKESLKNNYYLLHQEGVRGGFWGGYIKNKKQPGTDIIKDDTDPIILVGNNILGILLMDLRENI